jgi:hypothetical protein
LRPASSSRSSFIVSFRCRAFSFSVKRHGSSVSSFPTWTVCGSPGEYLAKIREEIRGGEGRGAIDGNWWILGGPQFDLFLCDIDGRGLPCGWQMCWFESWLLTSYTQIMVMEAGITTRRGLGGGVESI